MEDITRLIFEPPDRKKLSGIVEDLNRAETWSKIVESEVPEFIRLSEAQQQLEENAGYRPQKWQSPK
jgi:hypothetical protein